MVINHKITDIHSAKIRGNGFFSYQILLVFFIAFLTGCVRLYDPESSQDYSGDIIGMVNNGEIYGQSFTSRRPGLSAIELWISGTPDSNNQDGILYFKLFHTISDPYPLESMQIPFKDLRVSNPFRVTFPPRNDPEGQNYYLSLQTNQGEIQVLGRDEDIKPVGTAYHNDVAIEADFGYRLYYDYDDRAFISDFLAFLKHIWLAIPLIMILILPGWLILNMSGIDKQYDNIEIIGLSIGLSLAVIPVLMSWTTLFNLRWSQPTVIIGSTIISAISIWRIFIILYNRYKRPHTTQNINKVETTPRISRPFNKVHFIIISIICILSLGMRLIMARDLAGPPWVDSVHHALITALITDHGGYPDTYIPFLNIENRMYHPGFHSLLATLCWITGIDVKTMMLLMGQVLNALMLFAVYLFTMALLNDSIAGLVASAISAFFTPMPAYYTSWGRYTQLAGLLVLPTALTLIIKIIVNINSNDSNQHFKSQYKNILTASLACGGLLLIHYRVAIFFACIILSIYISKIITSNHLKIAIQRSLINIIILGIIVSISIGFILPWFIPIIKIPIISNVVLSISKTNKPFFDFSWGYLNTGYGFYTLIIAGLGLFLAFIKHKELALITTVWISLLFFLANLSSMGLPGGKLINNTSVVITLFMPISLLGGYLISQIINSIIKFIPKKLLGIYFICLIGMGLFLSFWGIRRMLPILNPITFLIRQADITAIEWVRNNIAENETILINPFAWGYGLFAGYDGGYWISPLAGRKTYPPPILYGMDKDRNYALEIIDTCTQIVEQKDNIPNLVSLMSKNNINYVYLGARSGVISPRLMNESGFFNVIYQKEGVQIFQRK